MCGNKCSVHLPSSVHLKSTVQQLCWVEVKNYGCICYKDTMLKLLEPFLEAILDDNAPLTRTSETQGRETFCKHKLFLGCNRCGKRPSCQSEKFKQKESQRSKPRGYDHVFTHFTKVVASGTDSDPCDPCACAHRAALCVTLGSPLCACRAWCLVQLSLCVLCLSFVAGEWSRPLSTPGARALVASTSPRCRHLGGETRALQLKIRGSLAT